MGKVEAYILTDGTILSAIGRLANRYKLPIRECFESYCYTDEKCAVCEEAYVNLEDGDDSKISLMSSNVSFCCKRCLFNGWLDVVNYCRNLGHGVCLFPNCDSVLRPTDELHSAYEKNLVEVYIHNELQGTGNPCCDPLCSRLGFSQTESMDIPEEDLNTTSFFLTPKLYYSRKHAVSSKIVEKIRNNVAAPSTLNVQVNCQAQMSNAANELHNTYPYGPILHSDLWFHSMFHAIAYQMCCVKKADAVANTVRRTLSTGKVIAMLGGLQLSDEEVDQFLLDTSNISLPVTLNGKVILGGEVVHVSGEVGRNGCCLLNCPGFLCVSSAV